MDGARRSCQRQNGQSWAVCGDQRGEGFGKKKGEQRGPGLMLDVATEMSIPGGLAGRGTCRAAGREDEKGGRKKRQAMQGSYQNGSFH